MDVKHFVEQVLSALSGALPFGRVSVQTEGPIVEGRAFLQENRFLRFYYNERTGTTVFALIEDERRAWGIDCDQRRGWHLHPVSAPEEHVEIAPLTVAEIIERLRRDVLPGVGPQR
jgi:hypothetical protein